MNSLSKNAPLPLAPLRLWRGSPDRCWVCREVTDIWVLAEVGGVRWDGSPQLRKVPCCGVGCYQGIAAAHRKHLDNQAGEWVANPVACLNHHAPWAGPPEAERVTVLSFIANLWHDTFG